MSSTEDNSTHFGYKTVAADDKADMVRGVFDSVASRYDVMNDLMSAGLHRLWKRYTIDQAAIKPGNAVLDLAGGTGDLAQKFSRGVGKDGHVVLADINAAMLQQGRSRLIDAGVSGNVTIAQVDAQSLPFADGSFDCITMAFGLRNVTDKDRALESMFRVLKPGGKAMILEFSEPNKPSNRLMICIPSRSCQRSGSSWPVTPTATNTWPSPFACTPIRKRSRR